MSTKEYPSYAALGNTNTHKKNERTLLEKFKTWFHNFIENAE